MVKFKIIRIIILSILFFSSCALQLPPQGGEIDLTPPEIVSTYPISGTVNYSKKYFEIKFSEYVDKRSFIEALFISPTIEGEMIIDWSGKTVEVYFPLGFKENTTYVITIGSDVVDLNNKNRMANAFNLYFSTGSKIDEKVISGKVYDIQADGTMLFAYKFKSDTTNYLLEKAEYISQCGKDGQFLIQGLPQGTFRIFAVKDQFRDLIFQAEQDLIGIPSEDIYLSENDSSYEGVYYYLTKIDTLPPRVLDVKMLDQKHILVKFSEDINSKILKNESFTIVDSSSNLFIKIQYLFNPIGKSDELVLIPEQIIKTNSELFLIISNIEDNFQNILINEKLGFVLSEKPDTNSIRILKIEPSDFKLDFINPSIKIFFDDAFQKEQIEKALALFDVNNNNVPFNISFSNDAIIEIIPIQKLKPDNKFRLEIIMNNLPDASGNVMDTTIVYNFSTKNEFEFSGISGRIVSDKKNLLLILESDLNKDNKKIMEVDSTGKFEFERIIPGKYKLWAFEDKNKNGEYDFGTLSPFEFSEKFYFYPEVLEIKPRWSLTDIIFTID